MKLTELSASKLVDTIADPAAWEGLCDHPRASEWHAWNVHNDDWFDEAHRSRVQTALDGVESQPLLATTFVELAASLRRVRLLVAGELPQIPADSVTHKNPDSLGRFDIVAASAFSEGSLAGESFFTHQAGDAFVVRPREGPPVHAWVTFGKNSIPQMSPDDVCRRLGLAWPIHVGPIFRILVPAHNQDGSYIPTIFDSFGPGWYPDWRARPESERALDEPWGTTRDMDSGKAAMPELIVTLRRVDLSVTCIGSLTRDWDDRGYLKLATPA